MANSIPCDVVLLPDPLLAGKAISASQKLKQFDSLFVLENGKYYPHTSLYMLQLNTDAIGKVEELLATIARVFSPLQLKASRYDHTMGFVDAEYEALPELAGLQDQVIKALNPIRNGMREKDKARMQEAEGLALKNFQDFGYKYAGELFRPHITLSRLNADNTAALDVLDNISGFDGIFLKLGLFEMGDNGTCIRKISEFNLGTGL